MKSEHTKESRYQDAKRLVEMLKDEFLKTIISFGIYDYLVMIKEHNFSDEENIVDKMYNIYHQHISSFIKENHIRATEDNLKDQALLCTFLSVEVMCHARLCYGFNIILPPPKDKKPVDVNIRINPDKLRITRRGLDYIKRLDKLKERIENLKDASLSLVNSKISLVLQLELDYILERYRKLTSEAQYNESDIIITNVEV